MIQLMFENVWFAQFQFGLVRSKFVLVKVGFVWSSFIWFGSVKLGVIWLSLIWFGQSTDKQMK